MNGVSDHGIARRSARQITCGMESVGLRSGMVRCLEAKQQENASFRKQGSKRLHESGRSLPGEGEAENASAGSQPVSLDRGRAGAAAGPACQVESR